MVLEASSIGLDQNRFFPTKFEKVVFTNLSRDHLDYHKTLTSYKNSKILLFKKSYKKILLVLLIQTQSFQSFFMKLVINRKLRFLILVKKQKFVKILKLKKFRISLNYIFLLIRKSLILNSKVLANLKFITKYVPY